MFATSGAAARVLLGVCEQLVSTQRVPHSAMDRRLCGCLDCPDGATGTTTHVRASVSKGFPALEAPEGTSNRGSSKVVPNKYSRQYVGCSRTHAPDGATAGTKVVAGASVLFMGVGAGVHSGVGAGVGESVVGASVAAEARELPHNRMMGVPLEYP
jgi:hypothetical protein